jgi:hypothetical protein
MRSRLRRVSRLTLFLALVVLALIVAGTLIPGSTGTTLQTAGWIALALLIIAKVGLRMTPMGNRYPNDRPPIS